MRSRKLLAFILCLVTGPALAGYMTLLGAGLGAIQPVAQATFTNSSYSTNLSNLTSIATFSRAGNAMQFDSSGYLTYGPNNLLTQSNTFSNAAWTKVNATITSGVTDPLGGANAFTVTATSASAQVYQGVSFTGASSVNFIQAVWVKRRTGSGTVAIYTPNGITQTPIAVSGSWQLFYISGAGNGANIAYNTIWITTSGDAIDVYAATLSAVTYETTPRAQDQVITTSAAYYGPRFDYTYNGSSWVPAGLLIEEARTNYLGYSSDFTQGAIWQLSNITPTANATTAPDGTNTAQKLAVTATTFTSVIGSAFSAGSTTGNAFTVYVKQGSGPTDMNGFILRDHTLSTNLLGVTVNYSTGAITYTVGSTGASMVSVGNGWWRLTLAAAASANGDRLNVYVGGTGGTLTAGQYMYAWGGQVEAGSFATSYIPTGASAVTRAAEIVQSTGAALSAVQGANWSAFIEFADVQSYAGNPSLFDNSSNVQTVFMNGAKAAFFPTILNTANNLSVAATHRVGVSATRTGGRSIVSDGSTVATDATAMTAPVNNYIGSNVGAGNFLGGHVRSLAIYNSRLPDATLQAKSVVGAAY